MDKDRLEKIVDFCREIDKEKAIQRQTYLADGTRKEYDSEHAWHTALMTILLSGYANEEIDVLKTVTMLLIHDLVEIDAGDTFAYDTAAASTQCERESAAADRIFSIPPEDIGQQLRALWEEFEAGETPEARFAHTMDNFQPIMLNAASGGKAWIEHGVYLEQILQRNRRTADGSQVLWDYAKERFIEPNVKNGNIKTDE